MTIYIIEHLEPRVWNWCLIEYEHISQIVGKENLWFTNVKNKGKNAEELAKFGKVIVESVKEMKLEKAIILDPEAEKILTKKDIENFEYLIFGGILGDFPPRKRTKEEITVHLANFEARNIGKEQMSTDNAVLVTYEISQGKTMEQMKFQDSVEIETGENESVMLPYRYRVVDGKPFMSSKLVEYIKKRKGF